MGKISSVILSFFKKIPVGIKSIVGSLFWFIRKHKIISAIIILLIVGGIAAIIVFGQKKQPQEDMMGSVAQTTELTKQTLSNSISVTGTLASADSRSISTNLNGTEVESILVSVGDQVKKGDVICTFNSSELEDSLEEAESDYDLASVKQSKSIDNATESVAETEEKATDELSTASDATSNAKTAYNEAVSKQASTLSAYESAKAGTVSALNIFNTAKTNEATLKSAVDTAKTNLSPLQTAYNTAKATYDDAVILYGEDNIPSDIREAYVYSKNMKEAAEAALVIAEANYKKEYTDKESAYTNAQNTEASAKTAYETACSQVDSCYAKYATAAEAQAAENADYSDEISDSAVDYTITVAEAENSLQNSKNQVQQAEDKLGECVVTSPIDGVITSINVDVGDVYESGTLFEVQDLTSFVVDATVDEYDIASIAKDQNAVIKTDATGDAQYNGIVTFVAPTPTSSQGSSTGGTTSSTSSYSIQISLTDTDEKLRVGMTAKTSIILSSAEDVFAVAYDSIETDADGNSFITVQDGTETKKIQVEVGLESDYYVEIISDELTEGMQVVSTVAMLPATTDSEESEEESMGLNIFGGSGGGERPSGSAPSGGVPSGGGAPSGF